MSFNAQNSTLKSLLNCGLHGAIGLLVGVGYVVTILFLAGLAGKMYYILAIMAIFAIYGAYLGYIFDGFHSRFAVLGAVAGFISGVAVSLVSKWNGQGSNLYELAGYPLTLGIVGLVYGLPRIKNMVLLAASGALGGAAGYGVYAMNEKLAYYLNDMDGLMKLFILTFVYIVAIGIPGASMAAGMYFTQGGTYSPKKFPMFFNIIKYTGIFLSILILLFSSFMLSSIAHYATTSASIKILTGSENTSVYVPVFMYDTGDVLEMYTKPTIKGDSSTAIIDTEYGKALKINGSGAIEIDMSQKHTSVTNPNEIEKYLNDLKFSMSDYSWSRKGGTVETWVYSEDAAEFSFTVKQDNGWGRETSLIMEKPKNLTKGWQAVVLTVRTMWYD